MQVTIERDFQKLTGFLPRVFQSETVEKLLRLQNVLLRAPTGSGKTETAIAPFLFAKAMKVENFPNKLIYIVPLRTLATSLRDRTVKLVRAWEQDHSLERPLLVTLQTGENPEDPRCEGDIVFCTIDQLLSSFLSIPYSVGRGSANVNAGVVFASYLVFDELHLLDPDRSFATTLKLLKQVQGISPYLLMTATLTHELARQVQQEVTPRKLNPEDVLGLVNVEGDDLKNIEGSRMRRFTSSQEPLSAKVIWRDIQTRDRQRVIVICNTVARSQSLFQDLQEIVSDRVVVTLLHSRFLPEHRKEKEIRLQKVFAENWQDDGICQVLISTQVVEAGINITSQVLHTQLCPMNSLLQRAGRCARFRGESGEVIVYRKMVVGDDRQALAISEDDDDSIAQLEQRSRRQFLPYPDPICELTWTALLEHQAAGQADCAVGFAIEELWINQVHAEEDKAQSEKRSRNEGDFEKNFDAAVFRGDRSVAQNLIRHVDSRSVFMVEDPVMIDLETSNEVDLRQLQAFSLPRTTIIKIWREFQDSHDRTWMFKKVLPPDGQKGNSYALPVAVTVETQKELTESICLIVNPKYVSYDCEIGLQIGGEGNYRSPPKTAKPRFGKEYSYQMDTYLGHLGRMWTCWERDFTGELMIEGSPTKVKLASISQEVKFAGGRFVVCKIFPKSTLEQATSLFELLVFLAIMTHDLGKLQTQWQDVMGGWQKVAFDLYQSLPDKPKFKIVNPENHLLAHTDHHPEDPRFKKAYDDYIAQHQRPPHAVESSYLSYELLDTVLKPILEQELKGSEEQIDWICHAIEMAAGRHHSAWAKGWEQSSEKISLHPQANMAIQESWERLSPRLKGGISLPKVLAPIESSDEKEKFTLGRIQEDDLCYQQLYWLVVRALRLCDGRSVQLH